jgi:hypothetical protein
MMEKGRFSRQNCDGNPAKWLQDSFPKNIAGMMNYALQ